MNFFYEIIPFWNSADLTDFWSLIMLLIFIGYVIYLSISYLKIKATLIESEFKKSDKTKPNWSLYSNTFVNNKTSVSANNFVNDENIFPLFMNVGAINNVSNLLVGLGVLGTFIGLTSGILYSSFETTEEIKKSITVLLSGVGTAFITSIWGMFLSLLFTAFLKSIVYSISKQIDVLCLEFDNAFKMSAHEILSHDKEVQKDVLDEYFIITTDDGKKELKSVVNSLLEQAVNQSSSLSRLSDDLSETIEEIMNKLIENSNKKMVELIEGKLVPVLEELKSIKEDSGTKMIEKVINNLNNSMIEMMSDFKDSISGDTQNQMDGLAEQLLIVAKSLESIPDTMSLVKEAVEETINKSTSQAFEQNKRISEDFIKSNELVHGSINDLYTKHTVNAENLDQLTNKISEILSDNKDVNYQVNEMLSTAKNVTILLNSFNNSINQSVENLNNSSITLDGNLTVFKSIIESQINSTNELLDKHVSVLQNSKVLSETYEKNFNAISEGLNSIFEDLQNGLTEYQNVTSTTLDEYLNKYTTALNGAYTNTNNIVSALEKTVEDLIENNN
tara:strand:+ start:5589 stop:7268 length:1680 start_codon:yes stop_codon:yes gene_type:complete